MVREDKHSRVHKEFLEDLHKVKIERLNRKLENKLIGNTELTRMARNSSAYRKLMEELSTLPRRKK